MIDAAHVYALDIETSTEPVVGPDGDPGYNPGLDPLLGFITETVVATGDPETERVFTGGSRGDEVAILRGLDQHLAGGLGIDLPAGLIATWGGANFDLPFVHTRALLTMPYGNPDRDPLAVYGLRIVHTDFMAPKYPPIRGHGPDWPGLDGRLGHSGSYTGFWRTNGGGKHAHLDIAPLFKPFAERYGITWGLKPVCEALGHPMISVDREQMHLLSDEERRAYVMSDGNGTRFLALVVLGLVDVGLPAGLITAGPSTTAPR